MYETFYGLNGKPFSLLPDPAYLYHSGKHEMALSLLQYAIESALNLCVITGEVGSGKTTLIRQLINELGDNVTVGLISNTHRQFGNLMQWVAPAFDLPFKDRDKVELYHDFVDFLVAQYAKNKRTLLIVDEAQNLDAETLEELRLLTNVNADDHQVLQMLLVGQPELHDLLKRHDLRQLAQRISVSHRLETLDEKETAAYIRHRVTVAGGNPDIFHKNALRLIYRNSGGVPRVINTLCDLALVYGFAEGKPQIDALVIADVARDRIDTGLYGDKVFGMESLRTNTRRPRRTNRDGEASVSDPLAASIAAEVANELAERRDLSSIDFVVVGTEKPQANDAAVPPDTHLRVVGQ
jgi:general secretion pathway protein A